MALPAKADRQMVAALEERIRRHFVTAPEVDQQSRGAGTERPRPDTGRPRCPLGVVKELFPGSDGVIRAARLRTPNGEITMPVAKLVALEPARPSDGRPGLPPGGGLR
ncbi:hypothetical protein T4D_13047 [Trichinella pseudospiralis]|uniref:DUF5641 domain-containing protein n=1 Tax=Trichinella pseudospiralis TaxID=6337 RepID=A0A0V1G3Y1_TRIPS|nr:hypothetical protein T4D_13047 [Trichinella pseudospiralis]